MAVMPTLIQRLEFYFPKLLKNIECAWHSNLVSLKDSTKAIFTLEITFIESLTLL